MATNLDYVATDFDPLKIRRYLESRGWKQMPTKKDRMLSFTNPTDKYAHFYLPLETETPVFLRGIEEIIRVLAQFEKRPESEIVTNLVYPDNDIVRYRIRSDRADRGTLSLSVIHQLTKSVIRSLTAAVCDVVSPKRHHPRLQLRESDTFLENAQFAQTERGSFVFKILCPLDDIDTPAPPLSELREKKIPRNRQVTSHLMHTVENLISAIDSGQEGQFVDRVKTNIATERVSADFCRAIADIQIWDDVSLELSTQWAPVLEKPDAPNCVEIKRNYFSIISKIADAIMPPSQELAPEVLIAVVDECKGEINDDGDREGMVVLKVFNNEGEDFKAHVVLNSEQYKIANDAHIGGEKHYLLLQGKLRRKSRSNEIVEITRFEPVIVPPENDHH